MIMIKRNLYYIISNQIFIFLLAIFTNQQVLGQIENKSVHYYRDKIQAPEDYAFVAHDSIFETPADICANTLLSLEEAIRHSALQCECLQRPNLQNAAFGDSLDRYLEFLPLSKGHFLIKMLCDQGAYNETWLFFAYNESAIIPAKSKDTVPKPVPQLLVFPTPNNNSPYKYESSPIIFARYFDSKNASLYTLSKMLGDGSGGYYAEYEINAATFVPTFNLAIYKDFTDNLNGYDFEIDKRPHGKNWIEYKPKHPINGTLIDLKDLKSTSIFEEIKCK
jgi:hypothetical protein